jgi:hypothetical protein
MKYIVSFVFLTAFSFFSAAQGSILDFAISPANPSTTDTVYLYTELQFSNGDCDLDQQSHTVSGLAIQANAHHCLGMLTIICDVVDTFKINPLTAGNYSFNLTLTSGAGPAPCTPGIIADDDSTFNFTVIDVSGVTDLSSSRLTSYPNPVQNHINLPLVTDGAAYKLITVSGQVVKAGLVEGKRINDLERLPPGMYFLRIETSTEVLVGQIAKE